MSEANGDTRISLSVAQLRIELKDLELRLVERVHSAVDAKVSQDEHMKLANRVFSDEERITKLEEDSAVLYSIGKYRKWLWAQTLALAAIAVPIGLVYLDHLME